MAGRLPAPAGWRAHPASAPVAALLPWLPQRPARWVTKPLTAAAAPAPEAATVLIAAATAAPTTLLVWEPAAAAHPLLLLLLLLLGRVPMRRLLHWSPGGPFWFVRLSLFLLFGSLSVDQFLDVFRTIVCHAQHDHLPGGSAGHFANIRNCYIKRYLKQT